MHFNRDIAPVSCELVHSDVSHFPDPCFATKSFSNLSLQQNMCITCHSHCTVFSMRLYLHYIRNVVKLTCKIVRLCFSDTHLMAAESKSCGADVPVVGHGISSEIVVLIAFAAFAIGVLLMSSLWFIHTRTRM